MREILVSGFVFAALIISAALAGDDDANGKVVTCPPASAVSVAGPEGWKVIQPDVLSRINTGGGSRRGGPNSLICFYVQDARTAFQVRLVHLCPEGTRATVLGDASDGKGSCVGAAE